MGLGKISELGWVWERVYTQGMRDHHRNKRSTVPWKCVMRMTSTRFSLADFERVNWCWVPSPQSTRMFAPDESVTTSAFTLHSPTTGVAAAVGTEAGTMSEPAGER